MTFLLNDTSSIASQFLCELRDFRLQKDSMRFRYNMERLGEIFAYEISKKLKYISREVETPLGTTSVQVLESQPVLATILRAGLPFHQGLLNFFDKADSAFISAYRKPAKSGGFEIEIEYMSTPDLNDRVLVVADPMLATGISMVLCCKQFL